MKLTCSNEIRKKNRLISFQVRTFLSMLLIFNRFDVYHYANFNSDVLTAIIQFPCVNTYSRLYRFTNCFGDRMAAIIAEGLRVDSISCIKTDGRRLEPVVPLLWGELFPSQSNSSGFELIVTCKWFGLRPVRVLLFCSGSCWFSTSSFSPPSSLISDTRASRCGFMSLQKSITVCELMCLYRRYNWTFWYNKLN